MANNFGLVEMPAIDTKAKVDRILAEIEEARAKEDEETKRKFILKYNNFWYRFWNMPIAYTVHPREITMDNVEIYIVKVSAYKTFGWKSKHQQCRYNKLKLVRKLCEQANITGKVFLNEYHLEAIENPDYYESAMTWY